MKLSDQKKLADKTAMVSKRKIIQYISSVLILALLFTQTAFASEVHSSLHQESNPLSRARNLLQRMTPEERIGQLFLIETLGTETGQDTMIYDLIVNHYLGGVLLKSQNDNFTYGPAASVDLATFTNSLQRNKYTGVQREQINPSTGEFFTPTYVPLFIGITQDGDGYPMNEFIGADINLPSYMALGATWEPEYAYQSGLVLGQLLDDWGINLFFGPSLDVAENPSEDLINAIGTRTFGGDPFWVSGMASAFTHGIKDGHSTNLTIVGKHFPGLGSADRFPEDEVSTVRRTLDQLEQVELEPFFALTGRSETEGSKLDGLLITHIRYQGLQGNIRAETKPINFDPQALDLLFSLPELSTWRESGGLLFSDDLNSRTVQSAYDPTDTGFSIRRPALEAFLAGNDMLILGLSEEQSQDYEAYYLEVLETLDFFTQKYREEPEFALSVDETVTRILAEKYELYELFTISKVTTNLSEVGDIQFDPVLPFDIARNSATLISPSIEEISDIFPDTPEMGDEIIIFTDAFRIRPCSTCDPIPTISTRALENSIISLYGPNAGGRIRAESISSYNFDELFRYLNNEEVALNSILPVQIERADWLVFVTQDISEERPTSTALTRLLNERPDIIQNKNIVVFSTNTPTILDSTNISKVDAFYALYSKSQPFIDVAARLLFKEIITPLGASPISIPGIGYYLVDVTQPNPNIPVDLMISDTPELESFFAPETAIELAEDTLYYIRTSRILDYNGNIVPDGTPVVFRANFDEQDLVIAEVTTEQGIAVTQLELPSPGLYRLSATTGNLQSDLIEVVKLTLETETAENPEETITPTATEEPTSTQEILPTEAAPPVLPPPTSILIDRSVLLWSLSVLISLITGFVAYNSANMFHKYKNRFHWSLGTMIGGILGYIYLYLNLPGSGLISDTNDWFLLISVLIAALIGWGITVLITFRLQEN